MRTSDNQVSFTMRVPYDNPDRKGVSYSYEAIQNALSSMTSPLPIRTVSNDGDSMIIGHTTGKPYAIQCIEEENIIKFTMDGIIHFGLANCLVNERDGDTITDFEIVGFGFPE